MKKSIFIIAALIISNFAFSQTSGSGSSSGYANGADKNFHFGLNVKLGDYWLSTASPNAANSASLGFGFGLNLEFYFTQNYGFCTGLEITSFGANYTTTTSWLPKNNNQTDSITANKYKMQYLEVPLVLKFRTLPIGLMKYFGMVGLEPGFRVKATNSYTETGDGSNPAGNAYTINRSANGVNASSETSILRLAYVIGAGAEYNIAGTTSLFGTLSFDSDFINMSSSSNSVTNKAITLTIGVLF